MTNAEPMSTVTISVLTRHSQECPHAGKSQWRRCNCRKSIYIYEGGKVTYKSAKTRSWEQAEKIAQAERDLRDPVKIELQKIAERQAAEEAAKLAKMMPMADALEQWIAAMKGPKSVSIDAYRSTSRRIQRWAASKGVMYLNEVTPAHLDEWRGCWSPIAKDEVNRVALTTQAALVTRLRMFFQWAADIELVERNPASRLKAVTPDESKTWPLTQKQFDELIAATYKMDDAAYHTSDKVGPFLRAIFAVQRWTGLRIGDALMLPKSALQGNRIRLNMQKTGDDMECVLPDHVVTELKALPSRKEEHSDYFFWSRKSEPRVNTNRWVRKIGRLNEYLSFEDDKGHPMDFRSHMLRDTFAVEMLLAGVPLEKVSKLLGHKSVTVTERYYAKWTQSRLRQLEGDAMAAMRKMGATFGGD